MANQKRKVNVHLRMAAAGHRRKFRSDSKMVYVSLSQIEDLNDRTFFVDITKNAASNAINENRAMNIPVTVIENGWVVKKTAAGAVERITKVDSAKNTQREKTLTKGTVLHVKARQ